MTSPGRRKLPGSSQSYWRTRQQRLYFVWKLRKASKLTATMVSLWRGAIESILHQCGTAPTPFPAARPCCSLWEQLRRSLVSLYPPYWTFTTPDSPVKTPGAQVTPLTHFTVSSACCHRDGEHGLLAKTSTLKGSYVHQTPWPDPPLILGHCTIQSHDCTTPPTQPNPTPPRFPLICTIYILFINRYYLYL